MGNQPLELPLKADTKELLTCFELCSPEDKEELLMLARYKAAKKQPQQIKANLHNVIDLFTHVPKG